MNLEPRLDKKSRRARNKKEEERNRDWTEDIFQLVSENPL